MSRHYPEVELFDLSVTYLLASDPIIWMKWAATERAHDPRRREGFREPNPDAVDEHDD